MDRYNEKRLKLAKKQTGSKVLFAYFLTGGLDETQ
jgi:hypothetical protein